MKYLFLFSSLGLLLIFMGIEGQMWNVGLFLTGISFVLLGISYGKNSPLLYGKRRDGTMSLMWLTLLPFVLVTWITWHIKRLLSREPVYDVVIDRLLIGRRPFRKELPEEVTQVVDMTAEFPCARGVKEGRRYFCLPTLDAGLPHRHHLKELINTIDMENNVTYVHCAEGHGRSLLFCVGILLRLEVVNSLDEGIEFIKKKRPLVGLNKAQYKFARKLFQGYWLKKD
jgi:protein-tyrosine phosphatase